MNEHYSDPVDQGSYLADVHNNAALQLHRDRNKPEQEKRMIPQEDGTEVLDWPIKECECGEDIEPGRLEHGFIRCFACQDAKEKAGKAYARR